MGDNGVFYRWVVKFVTKKEYNEYYCHNSSYALVDSVRGGFKIGFLIAGKEMPIDCREPNEFELKKIREWREMFNHLPLPEIKEQVEVED